MSIGIRGEKGKSERRRNHFGLLLELLAAGVLRANQSAVESAM